MNKARWLPTTLLACALAASAAACDQTDTSSDHTGATAAVESSTTTTSAATTTTIETTGPPVNWTKANLASGLYGHAMVYDPNTETVISFGGGSGDHPDGGTYAYDSTANTWTFLGLGPRARAGHAMAYDPNTQKIVMFGGGDHEGYFKDTWAYDPAENAWTELEPEGPVPYARGGHTMVYDPNTQKIIMFGGWSLRGRLKDLWAYDPVQNTWSLLDPAGRVPPGRASHTMVYEPGTGEILVYGGSARTDYSTSFADVERWGDLWAYDPVENTWTELHPSRVPGPRDSAAMVYHPGSGLVILFGGLGEGGSRPTTLWSYDPAANNWTTLKPAGRFPYGRDGHAMAYDAKTGKIIMFGGYDGNKGGFPLDGIWTLEP